MQRYSDLNSLIGSNGLVANPLITEFVQLAETAVLPRKNREFMPFMLEPVAVVDMGGRFPGGLEMCVLETDPGDLKRVLDDDTDLATGTELFEIFDEELGH